MKVDRSKNFEKSQDDPYLNFSALRTVISTLFLAKSLSSA